jgi:3-deoxy-7-phosphoheptulonate synthase
MPATGWTPASWRSKPIVQVPDYPDVAKLAQVEAQLGTFPPLVFAGECRVLEKRLAAVVDGKAFLLQGGDCAESFDEHGPNNIRDFFRVFLQMAVVLTHEAATPIVKVGRIAGQFAKPRSSSFETVDGVTLPSYRGDIINGATFDEAARLPNPERQLEAYRQSAATLNFVRALASGGYASLGNVHKWMLDFVEASPKWQSVADEIARAIDFMRACGIDPDTHPELESTEFFTSHEALLLGYEQALTRQDSTQADTPWVGTSGHLLWIGDRTRQPDHAHVEYCRGVLNPIGLKCGPSTSNDDLARLIGALNPTNRKGRLTLIARFGADKVRDHLPRLIEVVKKEGADVVWSCDPMHGNTISLGGVKTRPFECIMGELEGFFEVHRDMGTYAGGIHLEMTGKNVTECTGGLVAVTAEELRDRYDTACDPRLNAKQALDVAFRLADLLKAQRERRAVPRQATAAE